MTETVLTTHAKTNGIVPWTIGNFWQWFTEPSTEVGQPEHRRRARLLAALLSILIPLALIGNLAVLFTMKHPYPLQDSTFLLTLGTILPLGVSYGLSRTRHYLWGAVMALAALSLATLAAVVTQPASINTLLMYLLLPILLGSMLLPARGTAILIAADIVATLLLPIVVPPITYAALAIPLTYLIIMSALVVTAAGIRYRDLRQIEHQAESLIEASRQAEIANKLKDQFLANMSHELRTPLNAIIGFTEVMLMGLTGEISLKAKHAIERVHHNSERLLQLIDDILDISKIEAGRVDIVKRILEPAELLNSVELAVRPLASAKGLEIVTVLDKSLPSHFMGDAKRLEQILINLSSNAVKFTDQGTVNISLNRASETEWAIVVHDTGIGIPPHAQEFIFEKFRQVDGSSRRAYSGSGLGLAIVKELAMLMDGKVKVDSKLSEGSTFTVTFPLQEH